MKLIYSVLKFSPAEWPDRTYRTRGGDYSYCVDHDGTGWRLRIWHVGALCQNVTGPTATALMQRADSHAAGGEGW